MDIYQLVTDRIITDLEKGIIPWRKPWTGTRYGAYSGATGRPYSLLNQMMLEPGEYWTFNAVKEAGGTVKKGTKGSHVVFWNLLEKERDVDGEMKIVKIPMLRYFNVFNVNDCDGITRKKPEEVEDVQPIKDCETILTDYIKSSGVGFKALPQNEAFYVPAKDLIQLPRMEQFLTPEGYYGTAYHEAVHSTGHQSRLARFKGGEIATVGGETYSKEELIAEIGAAYLMAVSGHETKETKKNNSAYCQNWLKALKNDKKLIVSAAGKAEKAANYILGQ